MRARSVGSTITRVGPRGRPGLSRSYASVILHRFPSKLATPARWPTAIATTRPTRPGSSISCHSTVFWTVDHPIAPEQHPATSVRAAIGATCSSPCGVRAVAITTGMPAARTLSRASSVAAETEKSGRTKVPSRSATTASTSTTGALSRPARYHFADEVAQTRACSHAAILAGYEHHPRQTLSIGIGPRRQRLTRFTTVEVGHASGMIPRSSQRDEFSSGARSSKWRTSISRREAAHRHRAAAARSKAHITRDRGFILPTNAPRQIGTSSLRAYGCVRSTSQWIGWGTVAPASGPPPRTGGP
jgi:hypothetical protein